MIVGDEASKQQREREEEQRVHRAAAFRPGMHSKNSNRMLKSAIKHGQIDGQ